MSRTATTERSPRVSSGLWLLVLALVAGIGAFALVGLGKRGRVPPSIELYGSLIAAGFIAAWFVVRKVARRADPVLLPAAALLSALGFAVIWRLKPDLAVEQVTWLGVGLVAFVLTLVLIRDDRMLDAYTYTIGLAGLILLLLPIVPGLGRTINGARLWVAIGPISFQPAEFGKVLIVIFLASYLADKREMLAAGSGRFSLPRAKDLGPLMIAWATSLAVLFLEKDLGASLLYFAVFVVMLWIASGRPMFLIVGLALFVVGAWIGYLALSHVQLRVDYWLNALDPDKVYQLGYGQLAQGWFGMASGGIVGTGLGLGSPTLIPYAATDFIFAAIGEELGLLGTSAVLLIYLALIGRSLRVGGRARRRVRQAARHRPHDDRRRPDVRDRGRRDAADPADRHHAAVRLVRRIEPGRELRDPGAPDPRVGGAVVPEGRHVNRRIRRLGVGLVALIGLLFLQVSYIQVFAAGRIAADPANARRQIIAEYKVERGQIITADGTVIALSEPTGANASLRYVRRYPEGPLFAGITGFYSQVYGRTELEQSMNTYLAGDAPELAVSTLADLVLGRPKKGGHVITTINARLQRVAAVALGTQPGAVVAMDPRNGDVLAMVSNPTFDPNELSSQDLAEVRAAWERLNADPQTPLLSRANDELFPPGSTFKMVTASAALENGYGLDSVWPNPHELDLPLTDATIQNFGGETCPGGATTTLLTAFTHSCNVIFGEVGLQLEADALSEQAHAYGFCPTDPPEETGCLEPTIPFAIPFATGRFPTASYFEGNDPLLAISAIGQDNDLANPLQMALVASAIANRGVMMSPRLVTQIRDPQGRIIRRFDPEPYGQPISEKTATDMRTMMVNVVASGTGTAAQIPGTVVAGKTGTAQHGGPDSAPHAWFVCFAPAGPGEVPTIAVAVIVLDGGSLGSEATGGQVAAPIARQVLEAYLAG